MRPSNNFDDLESDVYHKWMEKLSKHATKHSKLSLRIQRIAFALISFVICTSASIGLLGLFIARGNVHNPSLWFGMMSLTNTVILLYITVRSHFEKAMYQLKCAHDLERLRGECDFNLKKRVDCVRIRKRVENSLTQSNSLLRGNFIVI